MDRRVYLRQPSMVHFRKVTFDRSMEKLVISEINKTKLRLHISALGQSDQTKNTPMDEQ